MATATASKNGKTAEAEAPAAGPAIQIQRLRTQLMLVPLVGTAPLITHPFSEKAKKQMLDAMQGVKRAKVAKDPEAEYESAFYRMLNGAPGMPALAFKAAIVSTARFFDKSVSMVALRQSIFVEGEHGPSGQALIEIEGTPEMREDVVRVGVSGTDLRYRPEFKDWRVVLPVRYMTSQLDQASVLSLILAAGTGVGVGEWRPERSGDFGTFKIDESRSIQNIDED
jgi:hypothetical protein